MKEMVERVASALSLAQQVRLYGRILTHWRSPEMSKTHIEERLSDAQTAIEALRVPTVEMLATAFSIEDDLTRWQAMIDEALKP